MSEPLERPKRERTFTWDNPSVSAAAAGTMTGIDYITAIMNGDLPGAPIASLMDFRFAEVSSGRVVVTCVPREFHYNPLAVAHGGLAATLLDTAMACAIHTRLSLGTGYTTVELHVNLVRTITEESGEVHCIGEALHVGRSIATAQGRITDSGGKLCAHATTTCLIIGER